MHQALEIYTSHIQTLKLCLHLDTKAVCQRLESLRCLLEQLRVVLQLRLRNRLTHILNDILYICKYYNILN